MKYLTSLEYAKAIGVSRQAIEDRIRRGTLRTVKRRVDKYLIPVEDTELENIK